MRHPLLRAAAATAVVVAAAAIIVAAAGAQSSRGRTIHFTATQSGGFFPHGRPHPGSVFGSTQRITADDGSNGSAMVLCTFITARDRFCTLEITTSRGRLTLQGVAYNVNRNAPFVINGGTGAYAVGRGTAAVNDVNQKTTDIAVTLAR